MSKRNAAKKLLGRSRGNDKSLVRKSKQAFLAAIEIYNKPGFFYKEESFVILSTNAWELLLKARIIQKTGDPKSIYVRKGKNEKGGRGDYKTTATGNYATLPLPKCLQNQSITLDNKVKSNIGTLAEIRNNFIHYPNPSQELKNLVHEIGLASVHAYVYLLKAWFNGDMSMHKLSFLPISFLGGENVKVVSADEKRLVEYIENLKDSYASDKEGDTHYAIAMELALKKDAGSPTAVRISDDPKAPKVQLSEGDFKTKYPWDYKKLVQECKKQIKGFKVNNAFHRLRKAKMNSSKYCYKRYLNLDKRGIPKVYYNPSILNSLIKEWT